MLPAVEGAAAIEKARIINSQIAELCSLVRRIIDCASGRAQYISQRTVQWKEVHSGSRWEHFLSETVAQLSRVLSLECRKHDEKPRTYEPLRMPEYCSFAFFVEKINVVIRQLSRIHLEIRRLLHLLAPNQRTNVATFNSYLYKRVESLRGLVEKQKKCEPGRGSKTTIQPICRLTALREKNKKRLCRYSPLLFAFLGRRGIALKAFKDMR